MNQTVRYILFISISMMIIVAWGAFFGPKTPPPGHHGTPTTSGAPNAKEPVATTTPPSTPTAPTPTPQPGTSAEPELAVGAPVEIVTPQWTGVFSPQGAGLTSFILKPKGDGTGTQRNLAHPGIGQPIPLSVDLSSIPGGFGPEALYQAAPRNPEKNEIVFTRTRGGVTVTKRFTYQPDSYQLHLDVSVSGLPAGATQLPIKAIYTADEPPSVPGGMFSFKARPEPHASVCLLAGDRSMTSDQFVGGDPLHALIGTPLFTGIDEKYFVAAMSPGADGAPSICSIGNGATTSDHLAILERSLTPSAGMAATTFDIYIGPKESSQLAKFDHGLDKSINYGYGGFLNLICEALLWTLSRIHDLAHNWGLAIILLTILMRGVSIPLTHKQMLSMEEGKRLNPLVEKIKVKYAGDNARIQAEQMKLYKEHNYQPLAGCFPMLIQMPVWFALYASLGASYALYKEPFIHGWVNDLTAPDHTLILPIAMVVTMLVNQWLTPQAAPANEQAAQMQKMMYVMPLVFGFIMMSLPAGLVLYNFTSTLLGIGQNLYFRRRFAHH